MNSHIYSVVCTGFMDLSCFVVLVHADQDKQTAKRDLMLHTKELELIAVLSALRGHRVLAYLHRTDLC